MGDADGFVFGEEAGCADAFLSGYIVDLWRFSACVAGHVFLPAHTATVGAESLRSVAWEVPEAEFVVGHREHARSKLLVVGLACAGYVTGAPTGVDAFPLAVVDLDCVPSVIGVFGRQRGPRRQGGGESEALAMTADDDGFHAGFGGYSGEETGVAFTDGKACGEGGSGSRGLDIVIEEGYDVILDVVMEPGEDTASLVGWRWEWGGQLGG